MATLKQGIHDGIDFTRYLADPCEKPSLTSTICRTLIGKTPAHAYAAHPRLGGHVSKSSTAMDTGTAIHGLVLGGDERVVFVDVDAWTTKLAKETKANLEAEGKIVLKEKQRIPIERAAAAATLALDRAGYYDPTMCEKTIVWQEPNGVWCRCRPDMIVKSAKVFPDLKSTTDARPDTWSRRKVTDLGYHVQAAMHQRGIEAVLGETYDPKWLVQEIHAPYGNSIVRPSSKFLTIGQVIVEHGIKLFGECLESGKWPDVWPCPMPDGEYEAEAPEWLQQQAETEYGLGEWEI